MLRRIGSLAAVGLFVGTVAVSGATWLYFLLYLAIAVVGSSYLLARSGLGELEAGSWVDRRHATVGDALGVTYTLRSTARLPKPWLEVHSPSTLPAPIPGRVVALGPRTARTWAARVPLPARGQFRIEPMTIRTGDPFGLFETVATVGPGASVLVYPRIEPLPGWRLPAVRSDGMPSRAHIAAQAAPLAATVRPYTPSDAFNRIHWRSSARHQELQVKEFDAEPSADVWLFLDLERAPHVGSGPYATVETAVSATASIAGHALAEGRGVGIEAIGAHRSVVMVDRGPRQQHKLLGLLAVAQPSGTLPLAEMLLEGAARVRRGMLVVVLTPSLDPAWVAPLAAMGARGVTPIACLVDPLRHLEASAGLSVQALSAEPTERLAQARRAILHRLAEHDVTAFVLEPGVPLGQQLASGRMAAESAV